MSFLQKLINLIQSLFQSSSPESQQRQVVKKIEAELRAKKDELNQQE